MTLVDFLSGITLWFFRIVSLFTWNYNGVSISILDILLGLFLFIVVVSILPRGGTT